MVENSLLSARECAEKIFSLINRDVRKREIAISTLKLNPIRRRIISYRREVNITPYVLGVRVFNKSLEGRM
ncbi:hypothetical protein HYT23_00325 [Candidatus Pacearchaeota archaeon]|nr:hypothetical protein [Candidatus Pacearchaeota archaeon]